jgi:hypothetical protein
VSFPTKSSANGHHHPVRQPNRRAWVRYLCRPETPGQTFQPESFRCEHARVTNLSGGGLGLLLSEPLPAGTALKVELEGRHGPRLLGARVVYVTEQEDGWLHGCELNNPLPQTELDDLLGQ